MDGMYHLFSASMRPPEFTGGNMMIREMRPGLAKLASMRPPEFTGGNPVGRDVAPAADARFNEAAGIHRRKHRYAAMPAFRRTAASMRPPEFTGGNYRVSS